MNELFNLLFITVKTLLNKIKNGLKCLFIGGTYIEEELNKKESKANCSPHGALYLEEEKERRKNNGAHIWNKNM